MLKVRIIDGLRDSLKGGFQPKLWQIFYVTLRRDLMIYIRQRSEWLMPILFFPLIASLFPMTISSAVELSSLGPSVIWVAALLANIVALDGLFRSDYQIGVLDQVLLSPYPTHLLIFAKIVAHWLVTGLPLVMLTPFLGLMFNVDLGTSLILMLSLLVGTPALSLIGALGVAVTISLARGGVLLAILVLPLYLPVLFLGVCSVMLSMQGMPVIGYFALMLAFLLAVMVVLPLAISMAFKVGCA